MATHLLKPEITLPLHQQHPCQLCSHKCPRSWLAATCQKELHWHSARYIRDVLDGKQPLNNYHDALALTQALTRASQCCKSQRQH